MNELHLIIVRHAQAVDSSYLTPDNERRLTPRGERDAAALGRVRRMLNLPLPDLVFSSGYDRAEQTLDRVLEGAVVDVVRDVAFSPEGSVENAWRLIRQEVEQRFPTKVAVVWMFGHNPNIERLLTYLSSDVGSSLRPYRKATLAWLSVSDFAQQRPDVQLRAYIPHPLDERDKTALSEL